MTDNSPNPVEAARSAVIDSMIAAGASLDHTHVTQNEALQYNSATDTLVGTPVDSRIPDTGHNIADEQAKVHARVNALQAQLSEKTFDPKTGTETYKVNDPAQRDQLTA